MRLHLFEPRPAAHIRKSLEYLEEANLAWVEHQAAAEHHAALAKMYAERIARIDAELKNPTLPPRAILTREPPDDIRDDGGERAKPESVVAYPSRATR
jgi:hypothetical protein